MKEYIDRKALIAEYDRVHQGPAGGARKLMVDAPAADVVDVRHGKWVSASNKSGVNIGMKCSLCGARIKYSEHSNGNHRYCHKCGAKMG